MSTRHIVYMGIGGLVPADRNPKDHDLPSIIASLRRFGWNTPAELDERTGKLVAGHGRREAAIMMLQMGDPPPAGVFIDDDGEWLVPVLRGYASRNDTEAEAYIIAQNKIGEAGGWFERQLAVMAEDVVTADAGLIETLGIPDDEFDTLIRKFDFIETDKANEDKGPSTRTVPDPDPHSPLVDGDEHVIDPPKPDLSVATKTYEHTCPNCGHTFED